MFQKPKPKKKRSPLKNRPLRLARQSLDEELKRLTDAHSGSKVVEVIELQAA
jgi:hypothetical protein